MVAGTLIIALSLALFIYWFRYSCILILRNRAEVGAASAASPDRRFSFPDVLVRLQSEPALDPLQVSLERDYRILIYLMEHGAGLKLASIEDRLLTLDYR